MKFIIILLGIIFVLLGFLVLYNPEIIFGFIEDNSKQTSLYAGAIVGRLFFGAILIASAHRSKYPKSIKVLGYIGIIAAIMLIIIGHVGFQDLISAILPTYKSFGRIAGIVIIALGGFLVHAFLGETR